MVPPLGPGIFLPILYDNSFLKKSPANSQAFMVYFPEGLFLSPFNCSADALLRIVDNRSGNKDGGICTYKDTHQQGKCKPADGGTTEKEDSQQYNKSRQGGTESTP